MQGQGETGLAQVRRGIAAWRATGAEQNIPYLCTVLAEVSDHLSHPEDGLQELAEAHALVEQHEERFWEAEVCRPPVYSWFTEGFDTADLQEAKVLLEELCLSG